MQEDVVVLATALSHYRGSYLAESHSVTPAGAGEHETLRHSCRNVMFVYDERAAVKMRIAQRPTDFKLLTDGERTCYILDAINLSFPRF